ncbi:hypothetical protein SNL152K_10827 [Streptomyces sp. NL15-2K]|nr:hypothetical protein [Kutzneria buriramensis]WKX14061.1 hypothetical protein Q4V64_43695 [Kutzneria buriramensis]GCB53470.1 hypothetical protein SNL152K_10827 [Streptomyces sp. NL15-2K]
MPALAARYGLFTLIVLGETVAAAMVAVKSALNEYHALGTLLPTALGSSALPLRRLVDLLRVAPQ